MNLQSIKMQIEKMICLKHDTHPKVTIKGSELLLDCCCDDFKNKVQKQTEKLIAKAIEKNALDMFKNL